MENTTENKAKFFAQYWGQSVLRYIHHTIHNVVDCNVLDINRNNLKHSFLELKPLSSITDEDAIEVAKLALGNIKSGKNINITKTTLKAFGFSFYLNHELEYMIDFSNFYNPKLICLSRSTLNSEYSHNVVFIYQHLQSKGYALPYMGLSVEELINRGWVKLKGS